MFFPCERENDKNRMKIQLNTNLEIGKNVLFKTFNLTLKIRRFAKRLISRNNENMHKRITAHRIIGLFMIMALFSFKSAVVFKVQDQNLLIGKWAWRESIHVDNSSYLSTPKSIGFRRSIVFNSEGNVITYKNDVEIRVSKYEVSKGISIFDHQVHDLLIYEGATYVIEELENKNLVLARNSIDGYRSRYYR